MIRSLHHSELLNFSLSFFTLITCLTTVNWCFLRFLYNYGLNSHAIPASRLTFAVLSCFQQFSQLRKTHYKKHSVEENSASNQLVMYCQPLWIALSMTQMKVCFRSLWLFCFFLLLCFNCMPIWIRFIDFLPHWSSCCSACRTSFP